MKMMVLRKLLRKRRCDGFQTKETEQKFVSCVFVFVLFFCRIDYSKRHRRFLVDVHIVTEATAEDDEDDADEEDEEDEPAKKK